MLEPEKEDQYVNGERKEALADRLLDHKHSQCGKASKEK